MPRTLSAAAKAAIHAAQTAQVFLMLLTISHPSIVALRLVNDMQDITSRGNLYQRFPFALTLPDESDDRLATVQLSVDNVDRQIVQAVRTIQSPATATLEVILASAPDVVEAGPFDFTLRSVEYDAR